MRYLSVCSGIEAATLAWHPLGWEPVAFSEIEKFPSAVLAHHYPHVPNWGDMTKFKEWPDEAINLLVGGTPCQSFSVAGLRRGLADPRGNLALTYLVIAERYRPDWLVWENVPGVLSADKGRAFGALLGGMEELGYGWAYRTLDAQFFGVAQRRRRVFVVASSRGWAAAASVLFEPESLRGDLAPSREAGETIAGTLRAGAGGGCGPGPDEAKQGLLIPQIAGTLVPGAKPGGLNGIDAERDQLICMAHGQANAEIATERRTTLSCNHEAPIVCATGDRTHALTGEGFDASEDGTGRGTPVIAFNGRQDPVPGGIPGSLDSDPMTQCIASYADMRVRRLTPVECERLQGMPDNYTRIPWRGKPAEKCPDGPRYKAIGNSMAVPVMAWIGRRMDAVAIALPGRDQA